MTLVALAITRLIERSRMGYALAAIRENEDAAEASGVNALATKLSAMAVSSFLTALGGTFYAQYFAYIDPSLTFGPAISIQGLLPAIVGGAGTVVGPLLGSFVLTPISELTRAVLRGRAGADVMLYGLILILVISFLPNGLVGLLRSRRPTAGRAT
jgi:branched-chain amino acid transport system permease protein